MAKNQTNFFSQGSPYLQHPLLTPERTTLEVDFFLSQVDLPSGARLLDVGCGFGRHSIELAQRGYQVVGIDPSPTMIKAARERAIGIEPPPEFQVIRAEEFTDKKLSDAAICLFTTLGQIEDDTDNRRLVLSVAECLQPDGHFLIEVPQRDWVVENLKPYQRFGEGDHYTEVVRKYIPQGQILTEIFTIANPHGERQYLLRYHLFSITELSDLLIQANFEICSTYSGYTDDALTADSPIIVILGRKRSR